MALKTYKPITPSLRQLVIVDRTGLWKGKPVKALTAARTSTGGRNNHGHITSHHMGGGHKRRLRLVDFKRRKFDVAATVERLEYDPNRSAFIALIKYADGELAYILAPQRLKAGDEVVSGERVDIKPGNAMPLANMPVGTIVHNVELKKGRGGQLARSAGTYAQLVGKDAGYAQIKLELRRAAPGAGRVPGHGRRGLQPGQPEHRHRQGRPPALARPSPDGSRRRHEPGRPSARRRRRQAPRAAAIRSRRGASRPRARRPARTRRRTSTSSAAVARRADEEIGQWHVPFGRVRSSRAA